jgi:hypothetical protein
MAYLSTFDRKPYTYVKLVSDVDDLSLTQGKFYPQQVQAIPPASTNIAIDNEDATPSSRSNFDFEVDIKQEVALKSIYLDRAVLPLLPQINTFDNTLFFTYGATPFQITLTNGFYTPNSLANEINFRMNTAINGSGYTVLVSYNNAARNITIVDTSTPATSFTLTGGTLLTEGIHVVNFGSVLTANAGNNYTLTSVSLEMQYSRYMYIRSSRLTNNQRIQFIDSRYSYEDCVGVVTPTEYFNESQYQTTTFPGTSKLFQIHNPININCAGNTIRFIDIRVQDEWGHNLSEVLNVALNNFQYGCFLIFVAVLY